MFGGSVIITYSVINKDQHEAFRGTLQLFLEYFAFGLLRVPNKLECTFHCSFSDSNDNDVQSDCDDGWIPLVDVFVDCVYEQHDKRREEGHFCVPDILVLPVSVVVHAVCLMNMILYYWQYQIEK